AIRHAAINSRPKEKFGAGIVGLGHVATHQIDALLCSEDFVLVAACDHDATARASLAATVDAYEQLDDMLERSDLDVVIVATPNRLHVEHGVSVMEAGKRLIIEKPVAETQADFNVLADTKQRLSAHCTVALHAAFGVEVEWFINELANGTYDDFEFESFHCQFYDPYVLNGQLQPGASSLGGSWIDSGINALSVICKLLVTQGLTMSNSSMNRSSDLACLEVQGAVDFTVSDSGSKFFRSGTIETDWTTGQNRKVTTLAIAGGSRKVVLDHSKQAVVMVEGDDEETVFECDNDLPRLTNHYIGVFKDLAEQIRDRKDNLDYCREMHKLLYQAESWNSG
ncbi:MAG: Gfo/Idh/MocA family protein, partial [Woeseiaceae bacterium]